jgi:hypothetical protein
MKQMKFSFRDFAVLFVMILFTAGIIVLNHFFGAVIVK